MPVKRFVLLHVKHVLAAAWGVIQVCGLVTNRDK